jgi:hypothetical protein
MNFLLWLSLSLATLSAFILVRNGFVHGVRRHFIYEVEPFPEAYDRLPDYDAMMVNPKYWLLWTANHWKTWLARNSQQERP